MIIGDINISLKNETYELKNYIDTFKSDLSDKSYTRKSNSIGTYIDHILTDFNEIKFNVSLIDSYLSDHRLIAVSFKPPSNHNYTMKKKKNEIKIIAYENIEKDINDSNLLQEEVFEVFHENIIEIIKKVL